MLLSSSISLDVTETNFLYWCVRFAGIPSDLVVPRPALPNCGGPLMVWKANSDSVERTASILPRQKLCRCFLKLFDDNISKVDSGDKLEENEEFQSMNDMSF